MCSHEGLIKPVPSMIDPPSGWIRIDDEYVVSGLRFDQFKVLCRKPRNPAHM